MHEELFDLRNDQMEEIYLANDSWRVAQLNTMRRRLEMLIAESR